MGSIVNDVSEHWLNEKDIYISWRFTDLENKQDSILPLLLRAKM